MHPQVSRKNIVVFTGAGISAESGLQTFRGDGGLWEGHRVEDVATPEAWAIATSPSVTHARSGANCGRTSCGLGRCRFISTPLPK